MIATMGLAIASCATARAPKEISTPKVSLPEIKAGAAALHGREVAVCGWSVAEFEVCEVSASIPTYPGYDGRLWVGPKSAICSLDTVTTHPTKGWADISGRFRYSKDPKMGFGQFGSYRSAIDLSEVKMRKTPCDN